MGGGELRRRFRAAELVDVALPVDLIECDAGPLIGLLDARDDPVVHLLPEGDDGPVPFFPLPEHRPHLLFSLGVVLGVLGVLHVEVPDEMVALDALGLGSRLSTEHLVGEHGLADVHAAVVDEVHAPQGGSGFSEDPAEARADRVVAQVAQVQRLVRVGAGELQHDPRPREVGALTVRRALPVHFPQDVLDHRCLGEADVHVRAFRLRGPHGLGSGRRLDAPGHLRRYRRRGLPEGAREGEQGAGDVAHFGPGRGLEHDCRRIDARHSRFCRVAFDSRGHDLSPLVSVFLHDCGGHLTRGQGSVQDQTRAKRAAIAPRGTQTLPSRAAGCPAVRGNGTRRARSARR